MVTGTATTPLPALPLLTKLATDSALDAQVLAFLQDKGIQSSGVLFHMFAQRDKIAKFLEPLAIGVELNGVDAKKDVTQLALAEATVERMMDELTVVRKQQPATVPTAASSTAAPATSSTAAQQTPPNPRSRCQ